MEGGWEEHGRGGGGQHLGQCLAVGVSAHLPALVLRRKTKVPSSFAKFFRAMNRSSPLTEPSNLSYVNPK